MFSHTSPPKLRGKNRNIDMSIASEFKAFVQRGNVVDMAIGVVMGTAFGKIVNSVVADILTPPLGYLTGGVDFKSLSAKMNPPALPGVAATPVEIKYGLFLQATFDFLIIAFCVFMIVTAMTHLKKKEAAVPAAPPEPPAQEKLLTEIRDLLRARG
jgi:large conductance mechanosensitive channel